MGPPNKKPGEARTKDYPRASDYGSQGTHIGRRRCQDKKGRTWERENSRRVPKIPQMYRPQRGPYRGPEDATESAARGAQVARK